MHLGDGIRTKESQRKPDAMKFELQREPDGARERQIEAEVIQRARRSKRGLELQKEPEGTGEPLRGSRGSHKEPERATGI